MTTAPTSTTGDTDDCVCGTPHQVCPGCSGPRCYSCIPAGTEDECDKSWLPGGDTDELGGDAA